MKLFHRWCYFLSFSEMESLGQRLNRFKLLCCVLTLHSIMIGQNAFLLTINEIACFTASSSALRIILLKSSSCCFYFYSSRGLRKKVARSGLRSRWQRPGWKEVGVEIIEENAALVKKKKWHSQAVVGLDSHPGGFRRCLRLGRHF